MAEKVTQSNHAADLRHNAEEIIKGNADQSPENSLTLSHEETEFCRFVIPGGFYPLSSPNSFIVDLVFEVSKADSR